MLIGPVPVSQGKTVVWLTDAFEPVRGPRGLYFTIRSACGNVGSSNCLRATRRFSLQRRRGGAHKRRRDGEVFFKDKDGRLARQGAFGACDGEPGLVVIGPLIAGCW